MDVKFLRGLYSNYSVLANAGTANADAFYITGPSDGVYDSIYLGSHLLGSSLASEIKLTGFNLGEGKSTAAGLSASDTVLSAIQKLDLALANATGADNAVISFGGKTGAITLSDAGNVTLTMVDNALKADVDLTHNHDDAYAPKEHDHDDVYAPKEHNHDDVYAPKEHNHDDVYQKILTAGDYINIDENNNITTVQGEIDSETEALVTNVTVKTYVDEQIETITNVLTWGSF
jgi:hypothetical protein